MCKVLDQPHGFCCPVAYGKEGVISQRDYKLRGLWEILFSSGKIRTFLGRRWNLHGASSNRLD